MRRVRPTLLGLALNLGNAVAAAEVVAVVSAENRVSGVSKGQVVNIFLGRASRFPDGTPAVPIDQAEGSSAREDFYDTFAGMSPAQIKAHWSRIIFTGRGQPPREVANGVEARRLIAENPAVIGYIEQDLVDGSVRVLLAQ